MATTDEILLEKGWQNPQSSEQYISQECIAISFYTNRITSFLCNRQKNTQ
ncbi:MULTISPECIES: hypothetical protein [Chryseobacterium]|uniref:Uncharacterized protein n=1 Tax=Chryseobacterium camelliae TaxID=1265445 RepID=A0ABU0TM66_9FLAO|nr:MULTISPECIES: hypothetical protein [Chryseobacterium]MDT3408009.1 hypothetical protein [Pseudacidovorax intermedius]MDQ1098134.1 hypothetical protein [Chryseobacterium camelliae]MDQ1102064.1 hypothetical protein [Chryseobacterium sp. SORGH_AS_1048]MDR6085501.1 hypothetical protein [Chryseobacterium sp. SORGH_AS_0909]MDR6129864.1 hypothetical protein [Chryseobacterium sp. SORGH_AS_1175]